MIYNKETGRFAFHSRLFKEDGNIEYVQYDYDGSLLDRVLTEYEEKLTN